MKISKDELIAVLAQFNPWWRNEAIPDLPNWTRAAFQELYGWITDPSVQRAILLSGARQVGKTTLLMQVIDKLLEEGVPPANILYVTFDHPLIKLEDLDTIIQAWREREPRVAGEEYLFLDEAQFMRDWQVTVKHQVDFIKNRRIAFTGSATPLIQEGQESGVGRWHTIRLATLSFYEYLQLKEFRELKKIKSLKEQLIELYGEGSKEALLPEKIKLLSELPELESLQDLFGWKPEEFRRVSELAASYVGHFHEYLIRGGFPQTVKIAEISHAQRLLREDIVDKVLKRDMTALFGVRRVLELEQIFLYLCMHDGGLLDIPKLCENLEITRPTVMNYIDLLESTHLIYRLQPFNYGKEILRAKYKIYLADAAIVPAVLLKGKNIVDDPAALGRAAETSVVKHLFACLSTIRLGYWKGAHDNEVDIIAETEGKIIPFEIKYRSQHTELGDLKGLVEFCQAKSIEHGFVVTKSLQDFNIIKDSKKLPKTQIIRIPAALLCYWMGKAELSGKNFLVKDISKEPI